MRVSLATRLGLLILAGLLAVWLMAIGLIFLVFASRGEDAFPSPERLAAIIQLFDGASKDERNLLLHGLSSDALDTSLAPTDALDAVPDESGRVSEDQRKSYETVLGRRPFVMVVLPRGQVQQRFPGFLAPVANALQFRVALSDGEVLVVETRRAAVLTRLGLPVGFGAGLLGTLIAVVALVFMQRETRPLRRLAAAADRIDLSSEPVLLPPPRSSAPEIRSLVEAFNRLQTRLSQLLRARMAMLGGISHDVRTFATRLRLRLDRLPDDGERERAIQDVADMIRLLDDALLASQAGAGGLAEELIEFDELVIAEVEDRRTAGAPIDLAIATGARGAMVLGDRVALRRVVFNLIDNAVKYGYVAHVALAAEAEKVVLLVDDEGTGVPEGARSLVMEPFVRLETSRSRETGGAGLGLTVVSNLVEAHGGRLSIGNAPAGGARFKLELPRFEIVHPT